MSLINNKQYLEDIELIANTSYEFDKFKNSKILITGATGLICSFLIDVLMYRNEKFNDNITIYAVSRNEEKILNRFKEYEPQKYSQNNNSRLIYLNKDICEKIDLEIDFDYIIHGASNTHPVSYSSDPVGTITTNIIGLNNIFEYCRSHKPKRIFVMSSVEIYGENRNDVELFDENYCGYINCNTLRAGYPESKRLSETLCQAYISKFNYDIVIGRFSRVYGPTMQMDDSKALAQFIKKALNNEDIVLKSKGEQCFSYCYVADAVSALIKVLLDGKSGEAYNIASKDSNIKLKDLAKILSDYNNKKVVYELPSETEQKGYSTATKALLSIKKIEELGWISKFNIEEGLNRTISILKTKDNE